MTAPLAQLIPTQTVQQIYQTLLAFYQANGFPVQSWQTGGVERTRLMAFATALASISGQYIPAAAAGNFLDYAPGTGWMPLLSQETYNLPQNAAVFTIGDVTLTSAAGVGAQTYQAGRLILVFAATGNRYFNQAVITIAAGPGSVSGPFIAEFAGANYADPSNSGALSLATPIPGVTPTNPASTYSSVTHVGSGTGSLTLGGSPIGGHQVVVRSDGTGSSGAVSWSYSLDGAPYVSAGVVATLTNLGGVGINVTLTNGASGTSFVTNDTFSFSTPGTWITQQGANTESDTALAMRDRNRWTSLSQVPVSGLYQLLAASTPSVGSQVTQVIVLPDSTVNNQVNVIVAGPQGPLPGFVVTSIANYIGPRAAQGDVPVVQSPATFNVTLAGTITVSASQLATAQLAIQSAMTTYVSSVGINGTIRLAAITELIMQISGVVDISGLTINAVAANLTLGSSISFIFPVLQPLGFGYVTV